MADRKAKDDPTVGHVDASCLIWTGAKYVDLTPSLMVKACTTYSMNSADATAGSYTVVGSFQDIHHDETDAFASHVDSAGNAKLVPYYDHFPAALYGVNSKGTAIGYSFSPFGYTYKIEPIFVTKPPELLTLLQPDCAMAANSCLEPLQISQTHLLDREPTPQCAFGGCTINDGGTVLGTSNDGMELYQVGVPSSLRALPPNFDPGYGPIYFIALNDADQLLYFKKDFYAAGEPVNAKILNVADGHVTVIPPVPGTSCHNYFPISINNAGEVLGFTSYCTRRAFYWTWDPQNGTQNLSAALPPNTYTIRPLGINDNAQILVALETPAGLTHWGTLDPLTKTGSSHARNSKDARHAR